MRQRELQEIFEKYGEVLSVNLIMDHLTRLNKGFGFVKMPDRQQALSAIAALHGVELEGRKLVVNESKYKKGEGRPGGPEARAEKPPKKYDSGPNRAYGKSNTDRNRGFKDKK